MKFKLSLAALGLMMSSHLFAAVSMMSPEEIVVLAINDQEVKTGLIRAQKNEFKVDPGNVTFTLRYQQYFEHLNGEHDILKSGVISIQAPDLKDGQQYRLALVNPPKDFDSAKQYAAQPTVAVYDAANKLIVQQTGANNEAKPWLSSSMFGRVFDFSSENKADKNQPAAVYATASVPATQTTVTQTALTTVNGADQQLIQIWQKASKAERQKFMSWLADQ